MSDLTKRELLAGMAMQGHCSNNADQFRLAGPVQLAEWSVKCADALLFELEKTALKPVADDDGWIAHKPGDPMPCKVHDLVSVKFANGVVDTKSEADTWDWSDSTPTCANIIAWRPAR